jgi:hypothetical protein
MVREMVRATAFAATLVGAAVLAAPASPSIGIAFGPFRNASLRVDRAGNAEVAWTTSAGVHDSVVVPPAGELVHGTLSGADVSRPSNAAVLPYRIALRRTPDGRLWALQAWQTGFKGPVELRLSRWTGRPTAITLTRKKNGRFFVLTGRATFHGRPVTGKYRTNSGVLINEAAQLDCFACPAAHGAKWFRFNGVKTTAAGTFGSGLKAAWTGTRYRATIVGPNTGSTLAPDAAAILRIT